MNAALVTHSFIQQAFPESGRPRGTTLASGDRPRTRQEQVPPSQGSQCSQERWPDTSWCPLLLWGPCVCAPRGVTGLRSQSCGPGSAGPCPQLCSADKDGCWDQTGDVQKPAAASWRAASMQLTAAGAHSSQRGCAHPERRGVTTKNGLSRSLPLSCGGWRGAVPSGPLRSQQKRGQKPQRPPHEGQACGAPA